jgi:aspartyl-tRNA(Asn)/glutamyl-tRNA(Gln) amidotransferase subunit A
MKEASRVQQLLDEGVYLGPLHGVPIAVKDNMDVGGLPTTGASNALAQLFPDEDAPVVSQLRRKGAVIVGKTNMYELAAGGVSPKYGDVHNPWDLDKSAGASSSGSACAVAAGLVSGATGTDAGGSVRVPASVCGVVGLKPTFDLVDARGVIPGSYNIDHVGFLAPDVFGVAAMLDAVTEEFALEEVMGAKWDPRHVSVHVSNLAGLRVGVPESLENEPILPNLHSAIARLLAVLQSSGASVRRIELPDLSLTGTLMIVIHAVEAAEYHRALLASRASDLSSGVRHLLALGETVKATDYVHCQRVREVVISQMKKVHEQIDILVLPTLQMGAWPAGAEEIDVDGKSENVIAAITRYTPLFNLTGQPAVSIPCGLSPEGLPLGVQLAGRPHEDAVVLKAARVYEEAVGPFRLAEVD